MSQVNEDNATIVVLARRVDDQAWDNLKAMIRDICIEHQQPHLQVELIDDVLGRSESFYPQPRILSFAIAPDHPVVAIWPALRDDILAVFEQFQVHWSALNVFHRRREVTSQKDDATILINALFTEEEDWYETKAAIFALCQKHYQPGLQVELINGMISRLGGQADEEYKTIPDTGSSTGPAGVDWASGTLGGFLQLRRPTDSPMTCGITCHHVLRPSMPRTINVPSQDTARPTSQKRLDSTCEAIETPQPRLMVTQPSDKNFKEAFEYLSTHIRSLDEAIAKAKADISFKEQRLERIVEDRKELRKERDRIESFDRSFGYGVFESNDDCFAQGRPVRDEGMIRLDCERHSFRLWGCVRATIKFFGGRIVCHINYQPPQFSLLRRWNQSASVSVIYVGL